MFALKNPLITLTCNARCHRYIDNYEDYNKLLALRELHFEKYFITRKKSPLCITIS